MHPRTVRLQGAATGVLRDLEGQPTRDLSSNDVSFHALRGYVPGDDRRYVHWRTSARTGVLMVRQFEETRRTHLAVALAADPAEYATTDEFEVAVSVAASLGAQALREERPVSVCVGGRLLTGTTGRRLLDAFAGVVPRLRQRHRRRGSGRRHGRAQRQRRGAGVRARTRTPPWCAAPARPSASVSGWSACASNTAPTCGCPRSGTSTWPPSADSTTCRRHYAGCVPHEGPTSGRRAAPPMRW